jgi:hypothetical protein
MMANNEGAALAAAQTRAKSLALDVMGVVPTNEQAARELEQSRQHAAPATTPAGRGILTFPVADQTPGWVRNAEAAFDDATAATNARRMLTPARAIQPRHLQPSQTAAPKRSEDEQIDALSVDRLTQLRDKIDDAITSKQYLLMSDEERAGFDQAQTDQLEQEEYEQDYDPVGYADEIARQGGWDGGE